MVKPILAAPHVEAASLPPLLPSIQDTLMSLAESHQDSQASPSSSSTSAMNASAAAASGGKNSGALAEQLQELLAASGAAAGSLPVLETPVVGQISARR